MSFISGLHAYEECISDGMIATISFQDKTSEQCILKQKPIEKNLIVNEDIVMDTNGYLSDKIENKIDATMYFEENLETCDKSTIGYKESIVSIPLTESLIDEKWDCETITEPLWKEIKMEEQESDEETIATFVTAAGQQLALYAVENSDEIFAVAVYDESGEPPSNFQFLLKADVERLIGEGAVRTVKKPSQMKKRLITTQPPVFYRQENFEEINERINDKIFTHDTSIDSNKKSVVQDGDCEIIHNYKTCQNYNNSAKINSTSNDRIHITADEQSDITYFMMDNNSVNIAEQSSENQNNSEFEDELIERSTVQYILLEGDHQSDSELTFDEIQAILQNFKTFRERALEKGDKKSDTLQDDESISFPQDILHDSSTSIEPSNEDMDELDLYLSPTNCTSVTEDDRQRLIDTLTDSPPSTTITTSTPQPQLKIKRSRKQQLISVNRDDGEIIIQPASMLSEEELTNKKRGRRRRRLSTQIGHVTMTNSKRIKRTKRREIVEVIDLDVDEEEKQPKCSVVEITLDDSKDKYSSDKENEIIMVRDSDSDNGDDEEEEDEEEEEEDDEESADDLTKLNDMMRCKHCSRNFRQRRTFNMHLRICRKSPANALRFNERKPKDKKENQKIRKQYACKICQEKFDVVVALARHVRAAHSQRKKHRTQNKSWRSIQRKEATSTEEEELSDDTSKSELSMLTRVKRKRRGNQRGNSSWKTKKLNCADCGRWFPSSALLEAHSLQHGTKKSEQLRRCHICKKLIKSNMLFSQHLKMHSDAPRMLRRRLRTRPSVHKIASPRKRGRPRKF